MNKEQEALKAFIEQPSTYKFDVRENEMIPEEFKDSKEISFTIKPPSPGVLAMCAQVLLELPEKLTNPKAQITLKDTLPYTDHMIKTICIIAHGKKTDYPEWWLEFLKFNTTQQELFKLFREVAIKSQSDFFLTSFQIANQTNPMMMKKINQSDSTPLDS